MNIITNSNTSTINNNNDNNMGSVGVDQGCLLPQGASEFEKTDNLLKLFRCCSPLRAH